MKYVMDIFELKNKLKEEFSGINIDTDYRNEKITMRYYQYYFRLITLEYIISIKDQSFVLIIKEKDKTNEMFLKAVYSEKSLIKLLKLLIF